MLFNWIIASVILPFITAFEVTLPAALPPPQTKPCPFDIFRNSDNIGLGLPRLNHLKATVKECLAAHVGHPIEIDEATCDQLICAYECLGKAVDVVS